MFGVVFGMYEAVLRMYGAESRMCLSDSGMYGAGLRMYGAESGMY